jgi:hypothetical protein
MSVLTPLVSVAVGNRLASRRTSICARANVAAAEAGASLLRHEAVGGELATLTTLREVQVVPEGEQVEAKRPVSMRYHINY